MPTIERWTEIHADLMQRLHLPCQLNFSTDVKIGQHAFENGDNGDCWITINPEVDFHVPEHLLLHEAAHHRAIKLAAVHDELWFSEGRSYGDNHDCCYGWSGGHCEHWAKILVGIYIEVGFPLPYSTGFEHFAETAGIKHKVFEQHGKTITPDTVQTR